VFLGRAWGSRGAARRISAIRDARLHRDRGIEILTQTLISLGKREAGAPLSEESTFGARDSMHAHNQTRDVRAGRIAQFSRHRLPIIVCFQMKAGRV